jgi:WD40 repeat protein
LIYDLTDTNYAKAAQIPAHSEIVRALSWSPDGRRLASGGFRELKLWQVSSNSVEPVWGISSNLVGRIDCLRFTPHGGAILVADGSPAESGWVHILSSASGVQISSWPSGNEVLYDLSISPDGGLLATAGGDRLVRLWEIISNTEIGQIEAHFGAVWGAAFISDSTELVTVWADKHL